MSLRRRFLACLLLLGCAPAANPPPGAHANVPTATAPAPVAPATTTAARSGLTYPATRLTNTVDVLHGVSVTDPYRWLEDGASEEVRAWTHAEDAFTRAELDKLPERERLFARFRELFDIERRGAPLHRGSRYFWTQKDVGKEKSAVFFREGPRGAAKVLLDPNTWSSDGSISLGGYSVSYDGHRVAYQVKKNNSDEATLELLDVTTGKKLPEVIEGAKYSRHAAWNAKGDGFYYVQVPPVGGAVTVADRPGLAELKFHRLGEPPERDRLAREATHDATTFQAIDATRDGRFVFAMVEHGWVLTDLYYLDPRAAKPAWKTLIAGQPHLYRAEEYGGRFYVMTDEGAPHFRVFRVDPARPERAGWTEIVSERPDATLDDLTLVGGRLALVVIKDVVMHLEVRELDGALAYEVALPEPGTVSPLIGNENEDEAYYQIESFARPQEVHRLSVKSGKSELVFRTHVPVDTTAIRTEQLFATSRDGTRVPFFVLEQKDRPRGAPAPAPALLYGYGGFSNALTPTFSSSAVPWLEHGGVFVIANLRGGSEYGEAWHRAGMRHEKQNVFDDFVAVAEELIRRGITRADRLVIRGDSNGGLLVGAALTERPELFRVALCGVPLLDMLRYHLYGSGKTWIPEYGSADDADDFRTLLAYSPYHHVKAGVRYPSVLLLSADSDDRVDPMHARKFAAALQAASTGGPVLLRIEQNSGHGGADKVQALARERADAYAFALSEVAH